MTSTTLSHRSHSSEHLPSSKHPPKARLRSSHSASTIDRKCSPSPPVTASSSSSSFSLDNERKNENLIGSATRVNNTEYFRKSNSLDSGYKTLSAASHGTSHTDTIDEESERHESFLQIASSPSSCSSSSYVVSNTNSANPKLPSKIDFIVDDEDDVDEKQVRLTRRDSRSNADGKRKNASELG